MYLSSASIPSSGFLLLISLQILSSTLPNPLVSATPAPGPLALPINDNPPPEENAPDNSNERPDASVTLSMTILTSSFSSFFSSEDADPRIAFSDNQEQEQEREPMQDQDEDKNQQQRRPYPEMRLATSTFVVPLRNFNVISGNKLWTPPMYAGAARLAPEGESVRVEQAMYESTTAETDTRCRFALRGAYVDSEPISLALGRSLIRPVEAADLVVCMSSNRFFD